LKTLVRHPLTGTGPFSFGLILLKEHSIPPDQPHAHAHNLILNVAAELGLPGLVALAVTLFLIVRQSWRTLQQETTSAAWAHTAACAAALTAFGAHGLVDMPMMFPAVMLLMLGILAAGIVAPQTDETRPQWLPTVFYRIGPLALWGIILAAGLWSAQHYTDYVRGERLIAGGQFVRGAEMLRQVAVDQPQFALYQAEYGYACGLAAYAGDLDYVQSGIDAYQRALDQESVHADWWANLAALYWQAGEPESAIAAMNQAVQVAPDSPDLWLNLGIYFEAAGRKDQAEAAYIHVLQADSYWGHTSFWNDTPLRQEIIANYPVEPTAYQQAEMLWQAGQPTDAVDLLIATIDHDPTQPGPYFRIARLYIAGGAFDQAESYLEAARVLVHADQDRAWIALIEGELALAQGDRSAWSTYHRTARRLLWPDSTGYPLNYGNDIANLQFLRVRVKGVLLPQLTILGPDPILTNLLRQ
ncbi:MAG: tetratricopeptide repeat protein, partial [Chloroflexi bacterium]|nr:tetratricopeptide repeat protein [Chloroflexota bacterium]